MKICFWGNIANALKGKTQGGGELQLALLAKALARGGNEVVIIDYSTTDDFITEDGIKVFKIKGWNDGIRIIRSFTQRLPKLYRILKAQEADIYYCRLRDFRHILAFWAAKKVKGKFVLGLASDLDASGYVKRFKYQHLVTSIGLWSLSNGFLIELVYPWLLKKADLVLVQHEGQKNMLLKKNIRSKVLSNLIDTTEIPVASTQFPNEFIYVGALDKRKGFDEFFKLVTKTPLISYKVIGQPRDKTGYLYFEKLKHLKNVKLSGRLSHSETINQIANSKALIFTSPMEGFPNVFIEAWACGISVLSLYFDPGVIEKEKLGKVLGGNLNKLVQAIENFRNPTEFATRAKSYVEHNHVLNAEKINEIHHVFNEVLVPK